MVLVAAVALGSSTYAWFVSNNTVKATTTTISAQSNAPFLKIDKDSLTESSTTVATRSDETKQRFQMNNQERKTKPELWKQIEELEQKLRFMEKFLETKGLLVEAEDYVEKAI